MSVRVRPRRRPRLSVTDRALIIDVAAPPVEGRATEEARRALAAALGVPAGRVTLRLGERSRTKVFAVEGMGAGTADLRLRGALGGRSEG